MRFFFDIYSFKYRHFFMEVISQFWTETAFFTKNLIFAILIRISRFLVTMECSQFIINAIHNYFCISFKNFISFGFFIHSVYLSIWFGFSYFSQIKFDIYFRRVWFKEKRNIFRWNYTLLYFCAVILESSNHMWVIFPY